MRDLDVGYLGVVVDDRDPQALFDAMVASVQAANLGWAPHNAALEVQILEAFALAGADWIYATNRAVGAMVESLLALNGVPRDPGAAGTGQITLTFDGSVTSSIAEGTAFLTDDGITLLAVRDTPIAGTSVAVDVEEAAPGTAGTLPTGTTVSPAAGVPRLSTGNLTTAVTGGRPEEDDLAYWTRCALRQRRVSASLATADDFTAAALEDPRVGRATTIDRWNDLTGLAADGHVTVVLHGKGSALAAPDLADITATLTAQSVSVLTVHVRAAQLVPVNITAGVTVAAGYDPTGTCHAARDVLTDWLGWDNAGFGQTVTVAAIEALVANTPGVSGSVVTTPTGNITHQPWQLPAAGTIDIHT